ncbi:MAG: hypothetical protein RDU59_09000 [Thermodesulfobacteriota bacterium]|nr:hypothetical protein [Thermodesulfobacteriota bacterium]
MPRSLLTDTDSLIETAITAARESGRLLKEIFGRKREVYFMAAVFQEERAG